MAEAVSVESQMITRVTLILTHFTRGRIQLSTETPTIAQAIHFQLNLIPLHLIDKIYCISAANLLANGPGEECYGRIFTGPTSYPNIQGDRSQMATMLNGFVHRHQGIQFCPAALAGSPGRLDQRGNELVSFRISSHHPLDQNGRHLAH